MPIAFQPGGSMEDYFKQVAKFGSSTPKSQEAAMKALTEQHGMEFVGPPLTY